MGVDGAGLCAIIRACHKSGVSRLKFGDVEVNFGEQPLVNNVSRVAQQPLGAGPVTMELSSDEKAIMEEADIADMMISDPEAWESYNVDRLLNQDRASN